MGSFRRERGQVAALSLLTDSVEGRSSAFRSARNATRSIWRRSHRAQIPGINTANSPADSRIQTTSPAAVTDTDGSDPTFSVRPEWSQAEM